MNFEKRELYTLGMGRAEIKQIGEKKSVTN